MDVIKVGDFDGNGDLDFAVTNRGANTLSIYLGNGDGTFVFKSKGSTGRGPQDFAIGDLNGDGLPDIATCDIDGTTMTVLFGKGDGTFTRYTTLKLPSYALSVAAIDLNGDGALDLVTTNGNISGTSSFMVLIGDGIGDFTLKSQTTVGQYGIALNVADLNQDGIPDLVVGSNVLTVYQGNGDATFQPTSLYPYVYNTSYHAISVGDFNGDGRLDISVTRQSVNANYAYSFDLLVLLSMGDGTFVTRTFTQIGSGSIYANPATDFNGDSVPDLLLSDGNKLSVWLGEQSFKTFVNNVTLSPGDSHSITISYSGSANYQPSNSAPIVITPPQP